MRDDSLQRVDLATNAITDGLSDGIDALGGGSKLEDCILQVKSIIKFSRHSNV